MTPKCWMIFCETQPSSDTSMPSQHVEINRPAASANFYGLLVAEVAADWPLLRALQMGDPKYHNCILQIYLCYPKAHKLSGLLLTLKVVLKLALKVTRPIFLALKVMLKVMPKVTLKVAFSALLLTLLLALLLAQLFWNLQKSRGPKVGDPGHKRRGLKVGD